MSRTARWIGVGTPTAAPRSTTARRFLLSGMASTETTRATRALAIAGFGLAIFLYGWRPSLLDRALGSEAAFAGTSFLTPDLLGKLRYGSEIVNMRIDSTTPGGLGTFGWDDEGVAATEGYAVKDGLFVGYLMSRETAAALGTRSNGTMRADGWARLPIIRMTNINLEPGDTPLADIIADTKRGIFVETNKSWSIDDLRLNFQFGCEVAWEIENGRLGRMLKNPLYTGNTPDFWRSCDAIADRASWQIWGLPNCGKGDPMQTMRVAHGAPAARFRNVEMG